MNRKATVTCTAIASKDLIRFHFKSAKNRKLIGCEGHRLTKTGQLKTGKADPSDKSQFLLNHTKGKARNLEFVQKSMDPTCCVSTVLRNVMLLGNVLLAHVTPITPVIT